VGGLGRATNQARCLMTQLLDTTEFRLGVESAVSRSTASVTILSAYLKHRALDYLMSLVPEGVEVRVASRFNPGDLMSGASDIEAAKLLVTRGAKFGISPRLHGKVFLIDEREMYIGSSNLTGSGFGLVGAGNEEFGTHCKPEQADVKKLAVFIGRNVQWLDAADIKTMEHELRIMQVGQGFDIKTVDTSWSFESPNEREVSEIWFRELPPCKPSLASKYLRSEAGLVNEFLVGYEHKINSLDGLRRLLLESVAYRWLVGKLKDASDNSLRFGDLTALLHASLLDDPTPYRSSIKMCMACVFDWAELIPDHFNITQHRNTRSLALTSWAQKLHS
jgi:hypothetical protein